MADARDPDNAQVEDHDLTALVSHEISGAMTYDQSELSEKRARALEYLRGEMNDVEPRPNGSKVTSRDVADTISWMLPGIMRVFMGSDRMAEYEPVLRDGVPPEVAEDHADQASDYANYVFFKDNDGYRVIYNATHDSLTMANGIVKHWWDDTPEEEISIHSALTVDQVALLTEDENVEILEQEEGEAVQIPDEMGQVVEVPTFDLKIKRTVNQGRIRIDSIERENFLIDEAAVTIDEARFVAHRDPYVTRSDLVERGFDRSVVEELSADNRILDTEEAEAREQDVSLIDNAMTRSTQRIDLYECYMRADVDGDGIAEMLQIWYAGDAGAGRVLDWCVWEDDVPFSDIPCYPLPHKFDGESVFDRTEDIQRVKTILTRQALDNLYASNLPMREVEKGSVENPDILVSPKFGGIIWKKKNTSPIVPHEVPFVADKVFAVNEYFDQVREMRTGVSRSTQALDPQALQNQTAEAVRAGKDSAYSQIELIARNQAELGWRRVFRQILCLSVKHQDRPRVIRLRGKFVEMDPRHWNASMDATVNTGLGTGSRDRDMSMLQVVAQQQTMLIQMLAERGFASQALDMLPMLLVTFRKMAEAAGLKNVELFYPDMGDDELGQMKQQAAEAAQQPPPEVQIEQMKLQADQAREKAQAEGDIVKNQAELEANMADKDAERQTALAVEQMKIEANERTKVAELTVRREEIASRERIALRQLQDKEAERERRKQDSGSGLPGGNSAAAA